ncbi:hypothetical protein NIIDMKKI_54820 [Mycobacterium kansasii]|uniref:Uncharacterized protein n=1 Tax=Mycobacterium kansasii TaxID=1768 RepID=A0A7G1IGW6_MYCKA|nr:hypothetical protein NIIDMKKI_54820 [Mycobacterium kansasii]
MTGDPERPHDRSLDPILEVVVDILETGGYDAVQLRRWPGARGPHWPPSTSVIQPETR